MRITREDERDALLLEQLIEEKVQLAPGTLVKFKESGTSSYVGRQGRVTTVSEMFPPKLTRLTPVLLSDGESPDLVVHALAQELELVDDPP